MKILYYTPFYPPQSTAAAVRSFWNIKSLKDAGHGVRVISSVQTSDSEKLGFNPADNKQSFLKRLIFEVLAGIELFFKILLSQDQVVILSTPPFITVSIAHLACRLKNTKYIIDVRDIYPDVYFAQGLLKKESLLGKLILRFTKGMYENSHAVVTVTPGLVSKIKNLAPLTRNIELLLNGFDRELFRPTKEKYEKFTVIFHGTMGKIQHLQTILDVAEELQEYSDIEFVFIGEGPQAELLKATKLSYVKYLGPKNYDEIPTLISRAHVGISSRRDDDIGADAFPVKVFEYLGVGIPVIMTPKTGIMSQLVGNGLFEFSNQDIKAIAQKILELKEVEITLQAPEKFSRQQESKKILKLLPP